VLATTHDGSGGRRQAGTRGAERRHGSPDPQTPASSGIGRGLGLLYPTDDGVVSLDPMGGETWPPQLSMAR
jgi:hypothetical protein